MIFHIQTPGPNDNVFFDANSFTSTGDTVTVDTTFIYCKSMDWTGSLNTPTFIGGRFNIYGSLTLISNMIIPTWNNNQISFRSITTGNTITCAGHNIGYFVSFDGVGGSYSMNDDFSCDNFDLNQSSFKTNGYPVNCDDLATSNSNPTTLLLNASLITASSVSFANSAIVDTDSAEFIVHSIICGSRVFYDITCTSLTANASVFNNVTFPNGGSISSSNSTFNKVIFFDYAYINGTTTVDTLLFNNPGKTITLGTTGMLTVNGMLSANPLPGFPIAMHSDNLGFSGYHFQIVRNGLS